MERRMAQQSVLAEEELGRKASTIRILSLASLTAAGIGEVITIVIWLFNPLYAIIPISSIIIVAMVICSVTYWLVRAGKVQVAGYFFVICVTLLAAIITTLFGGFTGPMAIIYLFPILIAGMVISINASFVIATLAAVLYLAMIGVEQAGLLPQLIAEQDKATIIPYLTVGTRVVFFYLIAFLSWFAASRLSHALQSVRRHAGELERDITERKQAEEALQESEERLQLLIKNAHDVIFRLELDRGYTFMSPSVEKLLGYRPEDYYNDPVYYRKITLPDDLAKVENLLSSLREGKDPPKTWELRQFHKDGHLVHLEFTFTAVRDEAGKIAALEGVARDITERKQAEEALRESEERYKTIFESVSDTIMRLNKYGKVIDANRRIEDYFGYKPEELIGKHFTKLGVLSLNDLPKMAKLFSQAVRGRVLDSIELEAKRKDGSTALVEVNTRLVKKEGKIEGTVAIVRDITERKRMEHVLNERVKELQCLYGIGEVAEKAGITLDELYQEVVNLLPTGWQYPEIACARITINGKEFKTRNCRETEWKQSSDIKVQEVKVGTVEVGYLEERPELDEGPFLKEERLLIDAVVEQLGRITERKRDEEELRAANKELREAQEQLVRSEKLAAIGQLAGGVGHELRNPLGAIKNAVYYIKGKVAESELSRKEPKVMEFLDIMDDETNSSTKIISDLLGFSRVGKPSVSPTQIKNVIEDALLHAPIPENIELTKRLDADLPEVEIDAEQVHQVLANMILNAVEAMPEGGKLTIGAREREKFLEVEIADTGCGIPQEAMDKIFDPLFTTKAKGIGLGLAVCKAIIDRHQGNIEVKSRVGKGTTFIIKLPLKHPQNAQY